MKVRILGGGWYGCHLAVALIGAGHEVELWEIGDRLFAGASGGNPARLHLGFHYPRSRLTRAVCQETHADFMRAYGALTRGIPTNVYAVAADASLVDFGTYCQVLAGEVEFVRLENPADVGLLNVEGAMLTGERHIVIRLARAFFEKRLAGHLRFGMAPESAGDYEFTIDCTFCARDAVGIDRFEPCVTGILSGPIGQAVTIMDGPFPSIYPWDESQKLLSLTSAKFTPLARCKTYEAAAEVIRCAPAADIERQVRAMREQIAMYWPESRDLFELADVKLTIRALPLSGADARLVDIVEIDDRTLRVRAGKIDAVMRAEQLIRERLCSL